MNRSSGFVSLCAALVVGSFVLPSHAAGPLEELYPNHITMLADFDDGTCDSPRFNSLKPRAKAWLVGEGGLFGTKGFVGGDFNFGNPKGRNGRPIADTARPGTVLFWFKLAADLDPKMPYDPGCTHVSLMWNAQKRFLVFRQDGKSCGASGAASMSAFFHTKNKAGQAYSARSDLGHSFRKLKKDEWHLVAATWKPDGVGISYDGSPFKNSLSTEPLGSGVWLVNFQTYWGKDKTPGYCVMDDCALLDFALSDGQVKALWEEYRAQMKETPATGDGVRVTLEKCGADGDSRYEIVLRAKNGGTKSVDLLYAAKARPRDSQPAAANEAFTLKPGEEKTLRLNGPALGEEPVTADFGVVSADRKTTYFRRKRVFAPHAEEPEWMRAPSAVSFRFGYYPYANAIHASADVTGCEDFAKLTSFKLALFKKGEKGSVAEKVFPADPKGVTEFFWSDLPELDGEYVCRLTGIGLKDVAASETFLRKHFPWERNNYGKSDAIPAPFTAVEKESHRKPGLMGLFSAKEEHVKTVGRDHTIGENGLWAQVNAAGKDILARPMRLVDAKSVRVPVDAKSVRVGRGKDSASTWGRGKDSASTEVSWDVDGLMEWRLTLKPGHYEPMALEIPVKGEVAWLYHATGDGLRSNPAGRIPAGEGRVWDSTKAPHNGIVGSYLPYVWIGGTLRGISVFGENDRGWVTSRDSGLATSDGRVAVPSATADGAGTPSLPCQEIIREPDGTVVLRLNLIQCAVDLDEARTIRIGFMATPVKPMLENWRGKPHGALLGACWYWGSETPCCSIEPYDGTDTFFRKMAEARKTGKWDRDYLEQCVTNFPYRSKAGTPQRKENETTIRNHFRAGLHNAAGARDKGKLVFYTNGRGVHYGDPWGQGRTFCNEWNRFEYFSRNIVRSTERAYDLDPVESYRDYAAWWYYRMFTTGACDHMYWDDVYLSGNFNLLQTDAYRTASGQIQPATGVWNMRAQIRRCAVIQAELGMDTTGNWVHMTNTAIAPICSFAGVNYDWEDSSGNEPMQVKYPKDYILACTIGRQMGNRVGIMGYFNPVSKERGQWLHRTGAGVMLTHELRWNLWSGHKDWEKYHELLCAWGYRTPAVDVWNYWDEDVRYPLAVSGVENASIAMAKKSAAEAYVCVSSFSKDDGSVTVTPDAATLGLKPGWKATDAETGKAIPVTDGAFRLDIPKYDWRLVKLD